MIVVKLQGGHTRTDLVIMQPHALRLGAVHRGPPRGEDLADQLFQGAALQGVGR